MHNMDESGFAIGEKEAGRCVINTQICQRFQANLGHQEQVSVIECVFADGSVIPPQVICKAEKLSTQWIPAIVHGHWRFSCNSKGQTSNEHSMHWLTHCFAPATQQENMVFSSAIGMTVTLLASTVDIAWTTILY